jgi:hypothetical protein
MGSIDKESQLSRIERYSSSSCPDREESVLQARKDSLSRFNPLVLLKPGTGARSSSCTARQAPHKNSSGLAGLFGRRALSMQSKPEVSMAPTRPWTQLQKWRVATPTT